MAKVIDNDIVAGLSGKLGKRLVFRHLRNGRTIVLTRPDFSSRVFSQEQLAHQDRFKQASDYARRAAKEEPVYAALAARSGRGAYHVALTDWFHPPVIKQVTAQAGTIRVYATDDVQVAQVRVTISDEQGNVIEQGQAALNGDGWWEYLLSSEGRVTIEAFDLAGNVVSRELQGQLHSDEIRSA
jgi:hypothetical protein